MTFLKDCRKAEDEDRIGLSKFKEKLKAAAATIPSIQSDEITKQLKKVAITNRHFGGQNEDFGNNFTNCPGLNIFQAGKPFLWDEGGGRNPYTDRRGDPGGRGLPPQSRLRGQPLPQGPPS